MSAIPEITYLYNELTGKVAASRATQRFNRQRLLEDEIFNHRPDYNEAMELLAAIEAALNERYNDHDLDHEFKKLKEALNEADDLENRATYEPEAYDSTGEDAE